MSRNQSNTYMLFPLLHGLDFILCYKYAIAARELSPMHRIFFIVTSPDEAWAIITAVPGKNLDAGGMAPMMDRLRIRPVCLRVIPFLAFHYLIRLVLVHFLFHIISFSVHLLKYMRVF